MLSSSLNKTFLSLKDELISHIITDMEYTDHNGELAFQLKAAFIMNRRTANNVLLKFEYNVMVLLNYIVCCIVY